MIETIQFNNKSYPAIQANGFASQYAFPYAKKFCIGSGLDIGCMKPEWMLMGSFPIDLAINDPWEAMNLPMPQGRNGGGWDYIFSSHCLEHLNDYVAALDYWSEHLKSGGNLFLYLPNMDYQEYWNPANNRKHLCYISPKVIQSYFDNRKQVWTKVTVTQGYDLNGSFYAIAQKI